MNNRILQAMVFWAATVSAIAGYDADGRACYLESLLLIVTSVLLFYFAGTLSHDAVKSSSEGKEA